MLLIHGGLCHRAHFNVQLATLLIKVIFLAQLCPVLHGLRRRRIKLSSLDITQWTFHWTASLLLLLSSSLIQTSSFSIPNARIKICLCVWVQAVWQSLFKVRIGNLMKKEWWIGNLIKGMIHFCSSHELHLCSLLICVTSGGMSFHCGSRKLWREFLLGK